MTIVNLSASIITLNMNGLTSPIIRYRVGGEIQKNQDTIVCYLQETHFRFKDTETESEGMEKDIPCEW